MLLKHVVADVDEQQIAVYFRELIFNLHEMCVTAMLDNLALWFQNVLSLVIAVNVGIHRNVLTPII